MMVHDRIDVMVYSIILVGTKRRKELTFSQKESVGNDSGFGFWGW